MEYETKVLTHPSLQSSLEAAYVQSTDGQNALVVGHFGIMQAKRACGCLLAPAVNDQVLLALLNDGSAWILQILTRDSKANATIIVPDKTTLAAQDLLIKSKKTSLTGENVEISGETVGLTARLLHFTGSMFLQSFQVIETLAKNLRETLVSRICHTNSLDETVKGLASRKAHRTRVAVETSYRLRAENADLRAKTTVDIDAEHIKLG